MWVVQVSFFTQDRHAKWNTAWIVPSEGPDRPSPVEPYVVAASKFSMTFELHASAM